MFRTLNLLTDLCNHPRFFGVNLSYDRHLQADNFRNSVGTLKFSKFIMYKNYDCDQYSALGDEPVSWSDFVSMFVRQEWLDAITSTFRRLYGWSRRANIFQPHVCHRVDEYFEEIVWVRTDRIRRAGGVGPPAIQWSFSV
jgi:hypothetical protein